MSTELFLLFAALAVLTALSTWINIKAGDNVTSWFSFLAILAGVAGMVYLISAVLFGWGLPHA